MKRLKTAILSSLRQPHVSAAFLYLVATLVMTYPVPLRLATHLAGSGGDGWSYVWNHWWVEYALRHPPQDLFYTRHQFYPSTVGLFTITLTLTNCLLVLPLQLVSSPLIAANVHFLFSFWLAGFATYLLARQVGAGQGGALVAGLAFAFCPYMTAHALGHFNLIATGWMPLFFLYYLRTLQEDRKRNVLFAAAALTAQMYAEFTLGIFCVLLASAWFVWDLVSRRRELINAKCLARLGVLAVLSGLAVLPYYLAAKQDPIVATLLKRPTWFGANEHGAPLVGFFLPSELHPVFGPLVRPISSQFYGTTADNTVYVGWSVLALSICGLCLADRRRIATRAAVLAVVFAVFALGPTLHFVRAPVLNAIHIDDINVTPGLPFTIFHFVPALRQMRIPTRFVIVTMLMLALLVGYGVTWLEQRYPRGARGRSAALWLPVVSALLVLFDFSVFPHYTARAYIPDVYKQLRWLPAKAVVLDLPFGARDGLHQYGRIIDESRYYQTVHQRPLIGGYFSRIPETLVDQYRSVPFLNEVAGRVQLPPFEAPCNHGPHPDAEEEITRLDVGVVVVHRARMSPADAQLIHKHLHQGRWETQGSLDIYYPRWVLPARTVAVPNAAPGTEGTISQ